MINDYNNYQYQGIKALTNLSVVDKKSYFQTVVKGAITNHCFQLSSELTNLCIRYVKGGMIKTLSVDKLLLVSQSSLLRELLANNSTANVELILADVEEADIKNLLNVLNHGSCSCSVNQVPSLYKLMSSLGFHSLARSIQSTKVVNKGGPVENIFIAGSKSSSLSSAKSEVDSENLFIDENESGEESNSNWQTFSLIEDENVEGLHVCLICGKGEQTPYTLRAHYTACHFFEDVAALITDKKSSQCELCGHQFSLCHNWFGNLVRHRGTTHQDVNQFIQRYCIENKGEGHSFCEICKMSKADWSSNYLAEHLIEIHYKSKISAICSSLASKCNICNYESDSREKMVLHIGRDHGYAMRLYNSRKEPKLMKEKAIKYPIQKSRCASQSEDTTFHSNRQRLVNYKKCHICGTEIQIRGSHWKHPMYNHISRKHFKEELLRDFRTAEMKCRKCGLDEKDCGSEFVLHLGTRHKLVETYLDAEVYKYYEKKSPTRMEETEASGTNSDCKRYGNSFYDVPYSMQPDIDRNIRNGDSYPDNWKEVELTTRKCNVLGDGAVKSKQKQSYQSETCYKKCFVCGMQIASSGVYWLYSHIARRHFKNELLRDFRTPDSRCSVCGLKENDVSGGESNFVLHLGAKERLVETYMDSDLVKKYKGNVSVKRSPSKEIQESADISFESFDFPDEIIEQLEWKEGKVDTDKNHDFNFSEDEEKCHDVSNLSSIGLD